MRTQVAIGALFLRLRDWWRRRAELGALVDRQVEPIAADLGISTGTLRDLVARGPEATRLLYERMRALGISKDDLDRGTRGVMRDVQRTCAFCKEKNACDWDLAERPNDPVWKSYCPNAGTLATVTKPRPLS
jgi:hypothetical protein